ncbi:Rieske (2Fe-2S) protein [Nocardioides sp. KR10-350]|uniref:Rieske (2Fe-2S) protein n=1 Tax=Nocardioides cheoyonin TaxID=3156615 RepID=UPI0032B45385
MDHQRPRTSRRHLLTGSAAAGVGLPLLAACGSDSGEGADPAASDSASSPPSSTPSAAATSSAPSSRAAGSSSAAPSSPAAAGLVATSEVPVGGGVVIAKEKVVVVQPTKGQFKGWSSTCTHMGCTVGTVSDGLIHCPCHGSEYSIEDGSVQGGPAPRGLPAVAVKVVGGEVDLA